MKPELDLRTDHKLVLENVKRIEAGEVLGLRVSAEHYLYLAKPYLRTTERMVEAAKSAYPLKAWRS
jgi:hypothetical protein